MNPSWWSQPFAEEGSAAAEGIVNQLGRPALQELTVLVREAAQNSWDARLGEGDVHFNVDLRRLGTHASAWRVALLPGPGDAELASLAGHLTEDSIIVTISDRGTRGLGGPLRAGTKPKDGERSDFVQFLRNVGEARDNAFGGGTYGFGKGIFYRLSECSTILVDSHTGDGTWSSRRLMGSSLGTSFYDSDDRRFTGRHWWGTEVEGIPDPLLGDQADQVARRLGLPGFDEGETGTDIVIIGARLEDARPADELSGVRNPMAEAAEFIASSILWNLWPKMIPEEGKTRMLFSVTAEGIGVTIPQPFDCDELRPFAEALVAVRSGDAKRYTRSREPRVAGELSVVLAARMDTATSAVVTAARPFDGPSRHVARMRLAELVVDYLPGPPHPDEYFRYGGVFRSVRESDGYFAESEPPTHDDWVASGLQGTSRGVVQGAKSFLLKSLTEQFTSTSALETNAMSGLGRLSSRLSKLTPGLSAGGAGPAAGKSYGGGSGGSSGGAGSRSSRSARFVDPPKLMVFGDIPYVVGRALIPGSTTPVVYSAKATVILDGGARESSVFSGAEEPRVSQWRPVTGGPAVMGAVIEVQSTEDTEWWVYATHAADAVIRLELTKGTERG